MARLPAGDGDLPAPILSEAGPALLAAFEADVEEVRALGEPPGDLGVVAAQLRLDLADGVRHCDAFGREVRGDGGLVYEEEGKGEEY